MIHNSLNNEHNISVHSLVCLQQEAFIFGTSSRQPACIL